MAPNSPESELFLFEEMKKGKEYAFDYFFNYYYSGLCVYARKMLPLQEQEACDIVQDVFVKIWKDRENIDVRSSVRSYLFVSVKNKCYDYFRKQGRSLSSLEATFPTETDHSPYETYVLSELETLFNNSLCNLPERCREIFEMSRRQGLKNREIAEKLGLSEKTVENQITKAIHILKKELKDYLPLLIVFESFIFLR